MNFKYKTLEEAELNTITSPKDVIKHIQKYAKLKQEVFGVITTDSANHITSVNVLFKGGVKSANIDKKILFSYLCKKDTVAFVVFHNHPSGNTTPSKEDMITTNEIANGADLLGMTLLDHIIIGQYGYHSFLENDEWTDSNGKKCSGINIVAELN